MRIGKIIFWILAMAAQGALAAPDLSSPMVGTHPDYQRVAAMRSRFNGAGLPAAGASKGEMVLALAETGVAAAASPPADWKSGDYDALYALLQKYRDELREMGFSQKQLEDELASLKVRAAELKDRLDKLQPRDGMKINGTIANQYDVLSLTGPGWKNGTTEAYRHGMLRGTISLNVVRGIISGEAQYYFHRVLSDMYTCGTCVGQLVALNVEVRTPIAFQAGDMDVKMSPLTMWRNEDEQPFEPEPFGSRRQAQRDQLRLAPDALRLRGARILTDLVLFDSARLGLEGFICNLGLPGQTIYQRGKYATLTGDSPGSQTLKSFYETYFGAWRVSLPLGRFKAAYIGTESKDATDTSAASFTSGPFNGQRVKGFDSVVHSGELAWNQEGEGFVARAEYAMSAFSDPNLRADFASDYLTGTALTAEAGFRGKSVKATLGAWSVDNGFTSSPAQGRTQDAEYLALGPFITENSMYNPTDTGVGLQYGLKAPVPNPPESNFNTQLLPPMVADASGNAVAFRVPYDWRTNAISPYGLATPNRAGGKIDLDFRMFDGGLGVAAGAQMASEKSVAAGRQPIAFTVYRGGLKLDLDPWLRWPISFSGGYTLSDARDGGKVAFSTALIDAGMEWAAFKGFKFQLGGRHLDFNGTLPYQGTSNSTLLAFGYVAYRQVYDLGGVGVKWDLSDATNLRISYTTQLFDDLAARAAGKAPQWEADQGFLQLSIVF